MGRSMMQDLNDPELFKEFKPGEYEYASGEYGGKTAAGVLTLEGNGERNPKAQLAAGGSYRRESDYAWGGDDGGHLIATRFGGSSGEENLIAQNRNLNRGQYKRMENDWARHLNRDEKVFVYIETSNEERPNVIMGYAIYENSNGKRDYDYIYFENESQQQIEQWNKELDEYQADHPEESLYDDENDYTGTPMPECWGGVEEDYIGSASQEGAEQNDNSASYSQEASASNGYGGE